MIIFNTVDNEQSSAVPLVAKGLHLLLHAGHSTHSLHSSGSRSWASFLLLSLDSRDNIIDSEQQSASLNRCLDDLILDGNGFPNIDITHVTDLLVVSINSKLSISWLSMLGSQFSDDSNNVHTTVSGKGLRNDLKGISNWIGWYVPALKGNCSTPSYLLASSLSLAEIYISEAPPPGTKRASV